MNESILTQQQDAILEIALNRPEAYNALNLDVMIRLSDVLASAARDESIKGIMLTGKGKAFCAGGDLKWISQQAGDAGATLHRLAPQFHIAILEIRRMGKPVVAAINGIAAGGGFSLALACDFRVMAESAVLRQAYSSSGLSIDGGGTFALPRLVGLARALEIAAFDQPISPAQAFMWGLVTKVVPDDSVIDESIAMLQGLAKSATHSFAWSKRLLTESLNNTLETQLELEREGISACARHPDGQEGIRAFVEKRKPVFSNFTMYSIIWEYQVKPDQQAKFERIYSPTGAWAELFNKGTGYLGTELIHSTEHPRQYLTIDRWASVAAYEAFLSQCKDAYEKLDAHCEEFTEQEHCLGRYLSVYS